MQQFLLDLYLRPELVKDLMDTLMLVKKKQIEAFNQCPSEVLYYDACWACDISPQHFKKWVYPDLKQAVDLVRAAGKYVGFYFLGKMKSIMPLIMETRPHFVETFETQGGDLTLKEAKRLYGKKVCLMGNFNTVTLALGNVEDAKREALRCLEEGMKGGGYVMVTGDEVPADTKLENLKMMVKVAEEYGRY